jgi:hypothetical protein
LKPDYNLNPTAGSRLGSFLSPEVLAKMSGENNHFYGKTPRSGDISEIE